MCGRGEINWRKFLAQIWSTKHDEENNEAENEDQLVSGIFRSPVMMMSQSEGSEFMKSKTCCKYKSVHPGGIYRQISNIFGEMYNSTDINSNEVDEKWSLEGIVFETAIMTPPPREPLSRW